MRILLATKSNMKVLARRHQSLSPRDKCPASSPWRITALCCCPHLPRAAVSHGDSAAQSRHRQIARVSVPLLPVRRAVRRHGARFTPLLQGATARRARRECELRQRPLCRLDAQLLPWSAKLSLHEIANLLFTLPLTTAQLLLAGAVEAVTAPLHNVSVITSMTKRCGASHNCGDWVPQTNLHCTCIMLWRLKSASAQRLAIEWLRSSLKMPSPGPCGDQNNFNQAAQQHGEWPRCPPHCFRTREPRTWTSVSGCRGSATMISCAPRSRPARQGRRLESQIQTPSSRLGRTGDWWCISFPALPSCTSIISWWQTPRWCFA